MKKSISFLMLISVIALLSCEKDKDISKYRFNNCSSNCIELIGQVIDASNEKNIIDTEISLVYKTKGGLINKESTIGQVRTDNSGIYNISFYADSIDFSNGYFRIFINRNGYLEKYLLLSERKIVFDSIYNTVTYLIPQGTLKLRFVNKNPYDSKDEISFSLNYKYEKYHKFNNLSDFESTSSGGGEIGTIEGDNVDLSESYLFPADEFVKISYSVRKNNVESSFSDSVSIKKGETLDYLIEY